MKKQFNLYDEPEVKEDPEEEEEETPIEEGGQTKPPAKRPS